MQRILLYTSLERNFRSTLLGYLYELQSLDNTEIIVLHEKLDDSITNLLDDKKIFPNIKEKIFIGQYESNRFTSFTTFSKLNLLSKNIINQFSPNIVITSSDFHSVFELLICKHSKDFGVKIVSIACSNSTGKMEFISKWIMLYSLHTKYKNINRTLSIIYYNFRKYLSHTIIHYLYPIFNGNFPLIGKSSFLLYKGQSGIRNADYQIVFSNQEKTNFIESGVQKNKLIVIKHPYFNINAKNLILNLKTSYNKIDFLILHSAELIGFNTKSYSLITFNERVKKNIEIIKCISAYFPSTNIHIKFHPNITPSNLIFLKSNYLNASNRLIFVDQYIPIEPLLFNSKVVLDLPRPVSTSLFMNTVINPNSISISLDLFSEFQGDYYKNNLKVDYITSIKELRNLLYNLKNNHFNKLNINNSIEKYDFLNLISFISKKKLSNSESNSIF